jgi:hypothetical protein
MSDKNLSGKDEALLILEYLESEQLSKTFLNFLDESKHLQQLRSHLYANYENSQQLNNNENDREVNEFQAFFNLSKQTDQLTFLSNKTSNDLFFDDDFLNDIISQTPPMDYQHDLPETPIPSIINHSNEDLKSIEELFATQHDTSSPQVIQILPETPLRLTSTTPYTKCIVVTQDFLQTMYNQSSTITNNNNINFIHRPKRRRKRRLKTGKENYYQQRKIMPRRSSGE